MEWSRCPNFSDGSTYEGEWAKGFMNGTGTFTSSDGTQKSGTWKWNATRIMSKENYLNKIKDLPETVKQFGGLVLIVLIIFFHFLF